MNAIYDNDRAYDARRLAAHIKYLEEINRRNRHLHQKFKEACRAIVVLVIAFLVVWMLFFITCGKLAHEQSVSRAFQHHEAVDKQMK